MLLNAILMFAIFDLLMKVEITTRKTLHKKREKRSFKMVIINLMVMFFFMIKNTTLTMNERH